MKKRITALAAAAALTSALLAGCSPAAVKKGAAMTKDEAYAALSEGLEKLESDYSLTVGRYTMELTLATMDMIITDNETGAVYRSSPAEADAENVPNADTRSALLSHVVLDYVDEESQIGTIDTRSQSVELGQADAFALEDGVRILYTIGREDARPVVPEVIRASVFEEVLANADERTARRMQSGFRLLDREELQSDPDGNYAGLVEQYPLLETENLYERRTNVSAANMQQFEAEFVRQGYDLAWIDEQYAAIGYTPEEQDNLFFFLPVEFRLDAGGFTASVDTRYLTYTKGATPIRLRLLPAFAATFGEQEEGYFLLPDGSGSVAELKSNTAQTYSQPIYGRDEAQVVTEQTSYPMQAQLPVFGASHPFGGYLAIVTGGDALATVNARTTRPGSPFNQLYAEFAIRGSGYQEYGGKLNPSVTVTAAEGTQSVLSIRYCLLDKDACSYTDMADAYRAHLQETGALPAQPLDGGVSGLFLDVLGYVTVDKNFLGFSYTSKLALTTAEQAMDLVRQLQDMGMGDFALRYLGYTGGGMQNGYMQNAKPDGVIGSVSDLQALSDMLDGRLYLGAEVGYVYNDTLLDGFAPKNQVSKSLSKRLVTTQDFDLATGAKIADTKLGTGYILSPAARNASLEAFASSLGGLGVDAGLSPGMAAEKLSSDFNEKNVIDRQEALESLLQACAGVSEGGLLTQNTMAPLLAYSEGVTDMPTDSSHYIIESYPVPFYAMVVHGYLPVSGEAVNLAGDARQAVLKSLESGAALSFQVAASNSEEIYDTALKDKYSVDAAVILSKIQGEYREDIAVAAAVQGQRILGHERAGDVAVTRFEHNTLYINYGTRPVTYDGHDIPGLDYVFV